MKGAEAKIKALKHILSNPAQYAFRRINLITGDIDYIGLGRSKWRMMKSDPDRKPQKPSTQFRFVWVKNLEAEIKEMGLVLPPMPKEALIPSLATETVDPLKAEKDALAAKMAEVEKLQEEMKAAIEATKTTKKRKGRPTKAEQEAKKKAEDEKAALEAELPTEKIEE